MSKSSAGNIVYAYIYKLCHVFFGYIAAAFGFGFACKNDLGASKEEQGSA